MRTIKFALLAVVIVSSVASIALAAERTPLKRSEVGQIKKNLVAVLNALAKPPRGYISQDDSFSLPTDTYTVRNSSNFRPVFASVSRTFEGDPGQAEGSREQLEEELQAKMNAAMAKGDMVAIQKLSLEYQQKMMQANSRQRNARKHKPIRIDVECNNGRSQKIDPDGVLFEAPGVIALKFKRKRGKQVNIQVFFDPAALKDTEQLSQVKLVLPKKGVAKKTAVLNFTIDIVGPAGVTEAWAKKIDTKAILRLIEAGA